MKFVSSLALFSVAAAIGFLGYVAAVHQPSPQRAGSSDIVILPTYPTMTLLGVGTSDSLVVASSSGRMRLEITNLSGATTTAQALYCNTGDRPSAAYTGIVIQA